MGYNALVNENKQSCKDIKREQATVGEGEKLYADPLVHPGKEHLEYRITVRKVRFS